jgi:hypothetical protein
MIGKKLTRLQVAAYLRENSFQDATPGAVLSGTFSIRIGSEFRLRDGSLLTVKDASNRNTWGIDSGMLKLERAA